MSESLPLHGIHYWELKINVYPANSKKVVAENIDNKEMEQSDQSSKKEDSQNSAGATEEQTVVNRNVGNSMNLLNSVSDKQKDPRFIFVGLCQVNENHSMEDTHKSQNSIMLNLLDSNFW